MFDDDTGGELVVTGFATPTNTTTLIYNFASQMWRSASGPEPFVVG